MTSATKCPCNPFLVPIFLPIVLLLLAVGPVRGEESFIVVEANSGRILMAQGALERRPVASLTKVATALVVLDWAKATETDLGTPTVVPPTVAAVGGANPMGLQSGDQITLRNALYSALLGSDNAAAQTLAHHVGGSLLRARNRGGDPVETFVEEMNKLAKALGMEKTRFRNAHGLEREGERGLSTATDMARLSIYAMRNPGFAFFVKQKSREVSFSRGGQAVRFNVKNTNELLGEHQINGIKTGMTTLAGQCLATSSELRPLVEKLPDGRSKLTPRRLICVVLGSGDRFGRTKALVPQGWALYDQWMKAGAPVEDAERELIRVPDPR